MKFAGLVLLAISLCRTPLLGFEVDPSNKDAIDRQMHQAAALFEQGHNTESRKLYQGLLLTLQGHAPSSQLGFVLNGLSKAAGADGDYKSAVQFARQSADIYHQIGDESGESHSLNNQGIAEIQTGAYTEARQTLEAALLLSRRAKDSENEVQVLNNLGSSYYFPGSYSEALREYDDAMALVQRSENANWADYWRQITSFNQATLFQRLGRYEKALQIYRQVEQSSKSLTPGDRAHLYANLGALYRRLGDPYKALDTYRSAQKLYSEQHDAGGELTVLKNIGIVYALDMEDLKPAVEIFQSAIALGKETHNRREEMQSHLYLAETLFRARHYPEARAEFETSRTLAAELGTNEEQWKALYGLGKIDAVLSDSVAAEDHYRQSIAIIEKTRSQLQLGALRSEFFADKREAYDSLIALLMQKNDVSQSFLFLERSRSRNFQDRLQATKQDQAGDALTLDQAREHLTDETALLEFWTSRDRVGLIWCTRQASGMAVKQLSVPQITQIHELLDRIPNSLAKNWLDNTQVLSALLPADISFLRSVRHLLIVPDGWVSFVPFDLVHVESGGNGALIEQYDISYLPTAALLRRPTARDVRFWVPSTNELVAFGDPRIDSTNTMDNPEELEPTITKAQRLPFSAQEIHGIADLAHGRRELFLERNDLKKFFLSQTANHAFILHVSTHAFADGDSPENSRLLFSPETPNGEPDYVFLRELYDMNLSNVRLATISACDTERGKIIRGEGIQAFSRALLSAGAASSITTLWRVEDEATSEFMKQFYYLAIHEHKPKAEALRLTKLEFLHSKSPLAEPAVWAAFVLNGDGATPLPSVWSWREVALLLLIVVAAISLAGIVLRLRSRRRVER